MNANWRTLLEVFARKLNENFCGQAKSCRFTELGEQKCARNGITAFFFLENLEKIARKNRSNSRGELRNRKFIDALESQKWNLGFLFFFWEAVWSGSLWIPCELRRTKIKSGIGAFLTTSQRVLSQVLSRCITLGGMLNRLYRRNGGIYFGYFQAK